MDILVSIPGRVYTPDDLEEFARRLDDGPFAGVMGGERICFTQHSPLATFPMLGGMTKRARLMTNVLVLPWHNPVLLAKWAATTHLLTRGRLVLGLGVGPRKPDFDATKGPWHDRGATFEQKLEVMRRVWRGEPPYDDADLEAEQLDRPTGSGEAWTWSEPTTRYEPVPPFLDEPPRIMFGGFSPRMLRRAGRLADGLNSFDFRPDPALHVERYATVKKAWDEAGRPGRPRLSVTTWFSLGPNAREIYDAGMREAYGYSAETQAWASDESILVAPRAIRDALKRFEDAGADEVGFATAHHLGAEAWDRLADAIG